MGLTKIYYLYIKEHKETGLKYLGKTSKKDPHVYAGSGKYWIRHLKKHGYNYTTKILFETTCESKLKEKGIYYSKLYNIVKSPEWANLMEETGSGGDNSHNIDYVSLVKTRKENGKTWKQSPESNIKRSKAHTGRKKSKESIQKRLETRKTRTYTISKATRKKLSAAGKKLKGVKKSKEHVANMKLRPQDTMQLTCPHCGKEGDYKNMKRWHMNNCRSRWD